MSRQRLWWWLLLGGGILLRLVLLPAAPLNLQELKAVLEASALAQGQGVWGTGSALLAEFNALAFALFGAGAGTGRWLPALSGCALLFIPWLWRRRIGETGALVATGLLALSPLALGAARRVTGEGLGVLGAALLWTAALTLDEARARRVAIFLGALVGLGGASAFYDALLGGLLAWVLTRWAHPDDFADLRVRGTGREWLIGVAAAAGALALGGWLVGLGLSAPFEGLAAWWQSWSAAREAYGVLLPFLYEPLTLLLALVAFGRALRSPSPWVVFAWLWSFGAWVLAALRPGGPSLAVVSCVPALVLLAGQVAEHIHQIWRGWQMGGEGAHAALALVLWLHAGQALARHTTYLANGWELGIVLLVVLMQGLLVEGFRMVFVESQRAWRGLLLGTAGVLLLMQGSAALGVAFWRADDPNEPLTGAVVAGDMAHLRATLSARGTHLQDVTVTLLATTEETPALQAARWALRDVPMQEAVRWQDVTTPYVITAEGVTPPVGWTGRTYVAVLRSAGRVPGCTQAWPPLCQHPLAWYWYRTSPLPYVKERVALWVR